MEELNAQFKMATVIKNDNRESRPTKGHGCAHQCNNAILKAFYIYGYLLGEYPVIFMVACVVICGGLGLGILKLDPFTDTERLYTTDDSMGIANRRVVRKNFPDLTGKHYQKYAVSDESPTVFILFRSKKGQNLLDRNTLQQIRNVLIELTNINVTLSTNQFMYEDVCARSRGKCVISGSYVFTTLFRNLLDTGQLTYPMSSSFPTEDMAANIGRPNVTRKSSKISVLHGAGTLFFYIPFRTDRHENASVRWESKAIDFLKEVKLNKSVPFDIACSSFKSLMDEVEASTSEDVIFFGLTFVLMITYAIIVSTGGNVVTTRAVLSTGGVLATLLGIVGTLGLVTLSGIQYVDLVGVMPYLLLGVGVNDMFLLMSAWSATTNRLDIGIPERMGRVFKKAGIGITITSVTNFLSFVIGATTKLMSVRHFCIYTGVGVIMCYLTNISFFGGCLAIHGRRIYAKRHTVTCQKVKSSAKDDSYLHTVFCTGSVPVKAMEDQSVCERGPTLALPRLLVSKPVRVLIILLFIGNLGVAIWGCTNLKQGLPISDLLKASSFVRKYFKYFESDFGVKLPISFVKTGSLDYRDQKTLKELTSLLQEAKKDELVSDLTDVCWLPTYANTPFYNNATDAAFMRGLDMFLTHAPMFLNDVVIRNGTIIASRCYVFSEEVKNTQKRGELFLRMITLAEDSPVVDFAYQDAFIYFELYVMILPTTLKAVGITIVVMCVVTALFLPHIVIVSVVMVQVVMIVTCIFGYMAIWELKLSTVTMGHLIMSAGLSVDFCAHVCTAYMVSEKKTVHARAVQAIVHASGPIFNGGMSSVLGLFGLLLSESYIFLSFFKVMLLVIGFGMLHAIFLVPALLSFIGPSTFIIEASETFSEDSPTSENAQVQNTVLNHQQDINPGTKAT